MDEERGFSSRLRFVNVKRSESPNENWDFFILGM